MEMKFKDAFYLAKRIAEWIIKNNKGNACTTKDIKEVGKRIFGEDVSRRTISEVKEILIKEGTVDLRDSKVRYSEESINLEELFTEGGPNLDSLSGYLVAEVSKNPKVFNRLHNDKDILTFINKWKDKMTLTKEEVGILKERTHDWIRNWETVKEFLRDQNEQAYNKLYLDKEFKDSEEPIKLKSIGKTDSWDRELYKDVKTGLYYCDTNLLPAYDDKADIHYKGKNPEGEPEYPINNYVFVKPIKDSNETFKATYTLKKGERAEAFKQYLRDRGKKFEPSEDGDYVVFVVFNSDEAVDRRVDEIIKTLKDSDNYKENNPEDILSYLVIQKGGSIGSIDASHKRGDYYDKGGLRGIIMKEFDTKEEAKEYAKRMRSYLTKGEKEYYRMGYSVVQKPLDMKKSFKDFNQTYLKKTEQLEILNHIERILKSLAKEEPQYQGVFGANNIVENRVWNELKKEKLLTKFPSNLYPLIRKVMFKPEIEKLFKKTIKKETKVTTISPSSEHKEDKGTYYGYTYIKHSSLGEFFVSADIEGEDIRTDGKPWEFLQDPEYRLSPEQSEWVNSHKEAIKRAIQKDGRVTIEDSFAMLTVGDDGDIDIPAIVEKEVRSLGGQNRSSDYDKVIASLEKDKNHLGIYDLYASPGLTLGERNDLVKNLANYDDLVVYTYGGIIKLVSEKILKDDAKKRIQAILDNKKMVSEDHEGLVYLTKESHRLIEEIANEAGLTRSEMAEFNSFMFGPMGYNIGIQDCNRGDVPSKLKDAVEINTKEELNKVVSISKNREYNFYNYRTTSKGNTEVLTPSGKSVMIIGGLSQELASELRDEGLWYSESEDLLSEDSLYKLFKRFNGDEDKVIEYLRKQNLDIPNGDLQGIVEAYSLSLGDYLKKGDKVEIYQYGSKFDGEIVRPVDKSEVNPGLNNPDAGQYYLVKVGSDKIGYNESIIWEGRLTKINDSGLFKRTKRINRSDKTRRVSDSIENENYQYLLKLLSDSFSEGSTTPFSYDGLSEYQDFVSLYEVMEGKEQLPEKPLAVLTYLYNELDSEGNDWEARLEEDKKKLEFMYDLKVFNSPEKEDAKYLVIGLIGSKETPKEVKIGDMKLTRKQKIYYAEALSKAIDPKFLRRNYRIKRIKERGKK